MGLKNKRHITNPGVNAWARENRHDTILTFVYLRFSIYHLLAFMEIELAVSFLLLLALTFLATVDMAFGQLSDVGLRRLAAEAEEHPSARYAPFLKEILEDRQRFSFTLSAAIQILLVAFSVLITYISLQRFSGSALVLFIALFGGLIFAAVFRQFIPRLISRRNPENKVRRMLPLLRPFYRVMAYAAEP